MSISALKEYVFIDDSLAVLHLSACSDEEAMFDVERMTGRAASEFSFACIDDQL